MNPKSSRDPLTLQSQDPVAGNCSGGDSPFDFLSAGLQNCLHGMFLSEMGGRMLAANRSFLTLTGYSAAEIRELDLQHLVDEPFQKDIQKLKDDVNRNGSAESFVELGLIGKTGQRLWVALEGLRIEGDCQPVQMLGIVHDLTERQALLDKLKSRETGYHTLINASLNAAF